jgi:hypothetical protein
MTDATKRGGIGAAVINSTNCQGDAIEEHLRVALERAESSDARFHIWETLQLLETE